MGSSSSKSRPSTGPEATSRPRIQRSRGSSSHLFLEDPMLSERLYHCFNSISEESIDEFLEREGSGNLDFFFGKKSLPTVEQINHGLALVDVLGMSMQGMFLHGLHVREMDISGSVADHLGSVNIGNQAYTFAGDLDIMLELDVDVQFIEDFEAPDLFVAQAHPSPNHIGFFSVFHGPSVKYWPKEEYDDATCLKAHPVREQFAEAARQVGYSSVTVNGPAITCQGESVRLSYDLVPCLRAPWPARWLRDFLARRRPAGWPGPQLLDQLKGGLHLVAKPPYRGERQLWRVSFSRPEALLARNLPPAAHFCLLMLRAVRSALGAEVSLIAPYYLKMCVFWLCERQQPERWYEMVSAMCTVLDALRIFAAAGFLPNFFRPSINVLARSNAAYRSRLSEQATLFRGQLQPVLKYLLDRFSRPWEQMMTEAVHPPAPLKATPSAYSQQRAKHSATAMAGAASAPPRSILIKDDVMMYVPDRVLAAAMKSTPDDDAFVWEIIDVIELCHYEEGEEDDEFDLRRFTWF